MFAIDHIAIWTADRDGLVARIAEVTGLPALDGFQPDGVIASRGVRFANGPFLDIFQAEDAETYLGLAGDIEAAERLSAERGWRAEREPRPPAPTGDDPPWDVLYWAGNRGVFNRLFLIDYAKDPAAFDAPSYRGALHKPNTAPQAGARLDRVWIAVHDPAIAAMSLRALGFIPAGPLDQDDAALFRGEPCDIVLTSCATGERERILRFDLVGAAARAEEPFGELLTLTALTSQA